MKEINDDDWQDVSSFSLVKSTPDFFGFVFSSTVSCSN